MRARRRTAVALLLACLSLATAGITGAFAEDRGGDVRTAISETHASRALEQAKAVFAHPAHHGKRELTPTILRLVHAIPNLDRSQRAEANRLLARPTEHNDPAQNPYKVPEHAPADCTAHFCVHWVDSTGDAPPPTDLDPVNGIPDMVDQVASVAETSYAVENTQLGWQAPKSDGTAGGDGRT